MTIKVDVDLYETGVATVASYATAGASSTPVRIDDKDNFSIIVIAGATNGVSFKVQVNNASTVDPTTDVEASAGWSDFVAEALVAAGATSAISYANTGFKWVRIIQKLNVATDNITWGISTTSSKPGY